jgi:uncharacterized membrane protein (UPF0136 family)
VRQSFCPWTWSKKDGNISIMTTAQVVLWVYIALLIAGGLIGLIKAGSKASIIASSIFAAVLALFALNILQFRYCWIILFVLLLFFGKRFWKGKKFMPSGMMAALTLIVLITLYFLP